MATQNPQPLMCFPSNSPYAQLNTGMFPMAGMGLPSAMNNVSTLAESSNSNSTTIIVIIGVISCLCCFCVAIPALLYFLQDSIAVMLKYKDGEEMLIDWGLKTKETE